MGVKDWIAGLGERVREWLDRAADALRPAPEPVPVPVRAHDPRARRR
jgi:hypothetical protein